MKKKKKNTVALLRETGRSRFEPICTAAAWIGCVFREMWQRGVVVAAARAESSNVRSNAKLTSGSPGTAADICVVPAAFFPPVFSLPANIKRSLLCRVNVYMGVSVDSLTREAGCTVQSVTLCLCVGVRMWQALRWSRYAHVLNTPISLFSADLERLFLFSFAFFNCWLLVASSKQTSNKLLEEGCRPTVRRCTSKGNFSLFSPALTAGVFRSLIPHDLCRI